MKNDKARKQKVQKILCVLKKLFPNVGMALRYKNNFELLVAVVLSAQCTDKKVNEVTKKLFRKYRKLDDYADANIREFEQDIFSTGFYRNKTKNIIAAAKLIRTKFKRKIPHTMEEILTIPGVARKTANVVLGNAYDVVEGIAVDTHVMRLTQLFGLTDNKTPEKIEQDLMEILPKKEWFLCTYYLIEYGRVYCPARHKHMDCPLRKMIEI